MKVRAKELSDEERIATLDALYTAAGTVKGRDAMKLFLRDLVTESERIMMGRRIRIARAILSGVPTDEIAERLRVGYDTIYKVRRWLDDKFPGYENAIRAMEKEFEGRQKKRDEKYLYATSALYRLKKKYPIHFLLFPTPKVKRDRSNTEI
jgi:uncharacterized protein YerC